MVSSTGLCHLDKTWIKWGGAQISAVICVNCSCNMCCGFYNKAAVVSSSNHMASSN